MLWDDIYSKASRVRGRNPAVDTHEPDDNILIKEPDR